MSHQHNTAARFRAGANGGAIGRRWLAALLLASTGFAAAELTERARSVASQFGAHVMEGRFDEARTLMDETMVNAFDRATFDRVRAALEAQLGEWRSLGEPWPEDVIQGYRRIRVPVDHASGRVDLRVVLDAQDRVAGFTVVPHAPRPDAAAPSGREIPITVGSGETALDGLIELPDGPGPFPGIVLVHGSGASDRDEAIGPNRPFRDISRGLAALGVAVLRYDKRSFAHPDALLALGDRLTVQEEVIDDARAALALLRAHEAVDASRVFLLGHSLGGTLAPRIAAAEPRPAGVVVLAGMTLPLQDKLLEQTRYIVGLDGEISEPEARRLGELERQVHILREALAGRSEPPLGYVLGAPFGYHADLARHDPTTEAAALQLPTLVLQGSRDYQITLDDFARWREALEGKPFACLHVYEGLDHLFRRGSGPSGPTDYDLARPLDPRVIEDVAQWILSGRCAGDTAGDTAGDGG